MIKRQSICHFTDKCSGCIQQNRCMSATSVTSELRHYFLKVNGYRQKQTPAMKAGSERHEDYLKELPTLTEYGIKAFTKDMFVGKKIVLQEVAVCSPKYGFHGIIDRFTIEYLQSGIINIEVFDLKPFYTKKYLKQISTYGLILSDNDCMICYDIITPRSKRKKRIAQRLYPIRDIYKVSINLALEFYLAARKSEFKMEYMRNNIMIPIANSMSIQIIKSANKRRQYHKEGIHYIEHTPPCKNCKQQESYCSLWTICQKINYKEAVNELQLYHGKKNLLIRTKPTIKR